VACRGRPGIAASAIWIRSSCGLKATVIDSGDHPRVGGVAGTIAIEVEPAAPPDPAQSKAHVKASSGTVGAKGHRADVAC
jgi:hypothetical protein